MSPATERGIVRGMPLSIQEVTFQSDSLEVSRSLAASLTPGRHELSSSRLERVYGDVSSSARARIAAELDHAGLVVLSEPCNEPLVVVKRPEMPPLAARESASHHAGRMKVLADMAADEAVRSGRPVALSPMTDTEREIVRERLRWRIDLAARSEGEGPERHVVVIPI